MRYPGKRIFFGLKKYNKKETKMKDADINNHHYYTHVM